MIIAGFAKLRVNNTVTTAWHPTGWLTAIAGRKIAVVALLARIQHGIAAEFIGPTVRSTTVAARGVAIVASFAKRYVMIVITTLRHLTVGLASIAGFHISVVALFVRVTRAIAACLVGRTVRRTAVARIGVAIIANFTKTQFTVTAHNRPTRA